LFEEFDISNQILVIVVFKWARRSVEKANNTNQHSGAHWEPQIDIRDYSRRLQVIVDEHPKEFIGVKLHQAVFLTGLDKYIGIVCPVQKY